MSHYTFDPDRSRLTIDGRSSVHGITATAERVVGWIETDDDDTPVTGHLTIEIDRLHTGNPLYDREIRNRLEVKKFPTFEAHLTTVHDGEGPTWAATGHRGPSRSTTARYECTIAGQRSTITRTSVISVRSFSPTCFGVISSTAA